MINLIIIIYGSKDLGVQPPHLPSRIVNLYKMIKGGITLLIGMMEAVSDLLGNQIAKRIGKSDKSLSI